MELKLTDKELVFVNNVMKPFKDITGRGIDLELLVKVLKDQYQSKAMVTNDALETVNSVIEKILYHQADVEIEKMLQDPHYGESTRAQSYKRIPDFSQRHLRVVEVLRLFPSISRADLAGKLGWPINTITPRVHELIDMGRVKVVGTKWDEETERHVETLEVVND